MSKDPIRRGPLAQQLNRQSAVQIESMSEFVECVVWKGPVGDTDANGVPAAYSPGFTLDHANGLEAIVISRAAYKTYGLGLSYGFWGAKPDDEKATTFTGTTPVTSGQTDADRAQTAKLGGTLAEQRKEKMRIVREYVIRVRIIGLDPDTVTLPRAEEWDVLVLGVYPTNVRFGLLIPKPDPTGQRWLVGTGDVEPSAYHEKKNRVIESSKGTTSPTQAAAQAVKAQSNLKETVAGDLKNKGGVPAEGTTHHKGQLKGESIHVQSPGEPDPAGACGADG